MNTLKTLTAAAALLTFTGFAANAAPWLPKGTVTIESITISTAAVPVMIAPYYSSTDDRGNVIPETNCSSGGTVKVDDFLALKSGPGVDFPRIAKLPNLQILIICNANGWRDPKGWMAVIVEDGRGTEGCFPGNSDVRPGPYVGSCKSGWVSEKYVGNLSD